jgi:arylsulfatase
MTKSSDRKSLNRRDFHLLSAGALTTPLVGCATGGQAPATRTGGPVPAAAGSKGPLNILFVFTDQERYFPKWPSGLSLPGHERLRRKGTTFTQHYTSAVMCTPSRSVLMTGLQTADNKMADNCDYPWQSGLPSGVPTVGHMLRKAGYYTAYKGKWHLNKSEVVEDWRVFTKEMEDYGFADFISPGDMIGHTLGGYTFDHLIAGSAITWLRRKGQPLSAEGKPWSLFVSLVNPHDIMYFNTDLPGKPVQDTGTLMSHAAPAPEHDFFRKTWDLPVATSLRQPLDDPGRPKAHGEFSKIWGHVMGDIPLEEDRWRRFNDYYINCNRLVDLQMEAIFAELEALGLADRTIVVVTADHGELAGAHGLRGKGPFAYEEGIHIPFTVVHPDVQGGSTCKAITSHIDVVPTLLSMAGVSATRRSESAGRDLPGKDLTSVLAKGESAGVNEAHEGVLFTYSGISTNDSTLIGMVAQAMSEKKHPKEAIQAAGYQPDLKRRGSLRAVFDGRHKFSRYFAPTERNRPGSIDELYRANDVELYDLQADPGELANLALDREKNGDLVAALSVKLEAAIQAEIGVDDGREMPEIPKVTWYLDRADL